MNKEQSRAIKKGRRTNLLGQAVWLGIPVVVLLGVFSYVSFVSSNKLDFDVKMASLFAVFYFGWLVVFILNGIALGLVHKKHGRIGILVVFLTGAAITSPAFVFYDYFISNVFFSNPDFNIFKMVRTVPLSGYFDKFLHYSILFGANAFFLYQELFNRTRMDLLASEKKIAEQKLLDAELKLSSLQRQLAPHFMFNCLSMLSALARMGKHEEVISTVGRLGELLRFVHNSSDSSEIPLQDEIDFVVNYIALQGARFGEKYHFDIKVDGSTSNVMCIPYSLQVFIENAYAHSFASSEKQTIIEVGIEIKSDSVFFQIKNNNVQQDSNGGMGTSISNLEERMKIIYNEDYSLKTLSHSDVFEVSLRVPR